MEGCSCWEFRPCMSDKARKQKRSDIQGNVPEGLEQKAKDGKQKLLRVWGIKEDTGI